MSEDISRRQLRRIMLAAVQKGMGDPAELLILSDALADHEPAAANALRQHPDVWGVMVALQHGCWRCHALLRRLRALVCRYAAACFHDRRDGIADPESMTGRRGVFYVGTDREREGMAYQSKRWPWVAGPAEEAECRTMRHVRRLVDRALAGMDVPPDIAHGLAAVREDMRASVLAAGGHYVP